MVDSNGVIQYRVREGTTLIAEGALSDSLTEG